MKTYTREELVVMAQDIFDAYGVEKVYATEDGQIFLATDKSLAVDHNAKYVNGTLHEIVAEGVEEEVVDDPNATDEQKKMAATIQAAKDAVHELVQSGKKTKAVKAELKKLGYEDDIIAIVTTKEALHEE